MKSTEKAPLQNMADLPVSAVYLAELSGIRPEDIHYWSRKGYIRNRGNGSKTPYFLGDLNKISLMKEMIESLKMEVGNASKLADKLVEMHADKPDCYRAAVNIITMFDKSLNVLTELLVKLGFNQAIQEENNEGDPP